MKILFIINGIYNKERKFKKKNQTALHWAAKKNYKDIGDILIKNGADINAKNSHYLNMISFFCNNKI